MWMDCFPEVSLWSSCMLMHGNNLYYQNSGMCEWFVAGWEESLNREHLVLSLRLSIVYKEFHKKWCKYMSALRKWEMIEWPCLVVQVCTKILIDNQQAWRQDRTMFKQEMRNMGRGITSDTDMATYIILVPWCFGLNSITFKQLRWFDHNLNVTNLNWAS